MLGNGTISYGNANERMIKNHAIVLPLFLWQMPNDVKN